MSFAPLQDSRIVYTACSHTSTRFDRFGDEVCTSCNHVVAAGVVAPNEGLESCSSFGKE